MAMDAGAQATSPGFALSALRFPAPSRRVKCAPRRRSSKLAISHDRPTCAAHGMTDRAEQQGFRRHHPTTRFHSHDCSPHQQAANVIQNNPRLVAASNANALSQSYGTAAAGPVRSPTSIAP